jgi:Ran GTPase-activating protein (RanGAP) involved in mRNA processing and transport
VLLLPLSLCSGNAIDVAGAKALAEALAVNTTLTSLTLSDNYIGVEGAKALAEALVQNKALAELAIKGNELGDEGVEALATALLVRGVWVVGFWRRGQTLIQPAKRKR